jgi:hypothetical protein
LFGRKLRGWINTPIKNPMRNWNWLPSKQLDEKRSWFSDADWLTGTHNSIENKVKWTMSRHSKYSYSFSNWDLRTRNPLRNWTVSLKNWEHDCFADYGRGSFEHIFGSKSGISALTIH